MANGNDTSYERIDTNYEFFPSVRQGYRPTRTFTGGSLDGRTTMGVDLTVEGRNIESGDLEEPSSQPHVDLRMYGPGDVTGIDQSQVIRVEPEPHTDTFPPNYFPLVEFDRADLPWLFSPERANDGQAGRARPWMCLVVVERDDDDVSIEAKGNRPLPALTAPGTQLPPIEEVWAWAHVQVVGLLSTPELDRVFTNATPQAVSRLLCPRKLDANTPYIAAVVPTFEPGRRIGLGEAPFEDRENPTLGPAWKTDAETTVTLPVYHYWEFATGDRGDFESMVRKLEPRDLATEYEIGVREVDMSDPGPIPLEVPEGLTRKLGGALRSPTIDPDPYPEVTPTGDAGKRETLRDILNDPATAVTEDDSDLSVVGPPIYGQWYVPPSAASSSAASLVPEEAPEPASVPTDGAYFDSWFHDLNVDPRYRIPSGYGTEVIQANQETLMEEAWQRFGDLEQANADIGNSQAGELVGEDLRERFEQAGDGVVGFGSRIQSIREVNRRIEAAGQLSGEGFFENEAFGARFDTGATARDGTRFVEGIEGSDALLDTASLGDAHSRGRVEATGLRPDGGGGLALDTTDAARFASVTSPAFRRLSRPGGKLASAIGGTDGSSFIEFARTKSDAPGAAALADRFGRSRADRERPPTTPPELSLTGLLAAIIRAIIAVAEAIVSVLEGAIRAITTVSDRLSSLVGDVTGSRAEDDRAGPREDDLGVDGLISRGLSARQLPDEVARVLEADDRRERRLRRAFPSEEAVRFDPELQIEHIKTDMLVGRDELPGLLDAGAWAIKRAGWRLHPGLTVRETPLDRIMAAPEFEWPMYEYLRDLDQQYLLPGVDEIPRDTIGALVTNPAFIEAFMCGLNHETGRELLWRRYPTDRRGTYFRQFWDYLEDAEQKDIKAIHEWGPSELGENAPGDREGNRVVLILRGDLLKAYPNTRIYAAKAVKEDKSAEDSESAEWDRVPLLEHRRQDALEEREAGDEVTILPEYNRDQLERWEPQDPIFRGEIDPDVTFFGFELTGEEAVGDTIEPDDDTGENHGWFFVLEEPVGETRFGFDVPSSEDYGSIPYGIRDASGEIEEMPKDDYDDDAEKGWNGLSWGHLVESRAAFEQKEHVRVESDRPAGGDGQPWAVKAGEAWGVESSSIEEEWDKEDEAEWGRNSAHQAHITWQLPYRVAVHADDILPGLSEDGDGGTGARFVPLDGLQSSAVLMDGDSE